MATTLRRHGDDMATTLRRHGDDVMTTWRRCGDDDDANGGEATAITTTRGNLPAPSCSITVSPPSWQSVMLSLGVCACVCLLTCFLCMMTTVYIYIHTLFAFVGPGVLIILYWAFGLHALHFTNGFCTLCICCCIPDMQTTIVFTKACQQTMSIQVRYSQVRHAWVHGTAFNAKGWRNWMQRKVCTNFCTFTAKLPLGLLELCASWISSKLYAI